MLKIITRVIIMIVILPLVGCTNSPETIAVPASSATAVILPASSPTSVQVDITPTPQPSQTVAGETPTNSAGPIQGSDTRTLICLDTRGDLNKATAADDLRAALQQLRQHPDWASTGLNEELDIAGECAVYLPDEPLRRFQNIGPGIVEQPGPWRLVVVVLDDTHAEQLLGNEIALLASYEMMEGGSDGAMVTPAVVVRHNALQEQQVLDYLGLALGLAPQP